ncbi:MAG: hypothetical protein WC728_00435 [Elusimicrobiota bacterium]
MLQALPAGSAEPQALAPQAAELSAPFDLRNKPELSAGELEFILQNEKYRVNDFRIEDPEAETPDKRVLTTQQVLDLLKARSASAVDALRRREKGKPLDPKERSLAVFLFWERRPLLDKKDAAFLAELLARDHGSSAQAAAPGAPKPGTALHALTGLASQGQMPVQAAAPAAAERPLLDRLLDNVVIRHRSGTAEKKALEETFAALLQTPTGREYAQRLVDEGVKAKVYFGDIEGSRLVEERGRKTFTGTMGLTYWSMSPIEIKLNKHYLQTDPGRRDTAAVLAHELFGHAYRFTQSRRKNLNEAYDLYTDDETNARMIEWVIAAEMGSKLESSLTWDYLKSPKDYYREIATTSDSYSVELTRGEMADPVKAYRERLSFVAEDKKSYEGWRTRLQRDKRIIEHFIKDPKHKMDPAQFQMVSKETDEDLDHTIPTWLKEWDSIERKLKERITHYSTPAGRKEMERLRTMAQDPFFADVEGEIARLHKRLQALSLGRNRAEETAGPPPTPGQITREALRKMYDEDRKTHPAAWDK